MYRKVSSPGRELTSVYQLSFEQTYTDFVQPVILGRQPENYQY